VGRLITIIGAFALTACSATPTLTDVQADVFTPSCAFSSCHGSVAEGGLSLEEGNAWAELVDVESEDAPGNTRVVPGDADSSYLMAKLNGDADIEGDPMPPSGGLTDAQIQSVRDWINAGALDD
jgi:hypothetical protein